MTPEAVLDVMNRTMWVALEVAGPLLAVGIVVGLFIGVIQAATQLSEPAIGFVPKLFAMGAALTAMGGWLLERLTAFGREMLGAIAHIHS
ncbi:MAG TPA: flagellar biosynthetic protein FliQ [Nannocystaceae bacterium]|nr:flagellar biosynthetic protein FliQ [Nannocystaceae bacterium]